MPKKGASDSPADETQLVDTQEGVDQTQDAKPAESSVADGQDAKPEPKSLLDVVREVVQKPEAKSAPSADAEQKSEGAAPEGDKPAEDEEPPFHKHPRWQQQKAIERDLRTKVEELTGPADQYRQITDFMTAQNLTPDDIVRTFTIAAVVRNDPRKALTELNKLVAEIRQELGEDLPDDLRAAVDEGEMTEERALEASRARAEAARAKAALDAKAQRERDQESAQQAERQRETAAVAISNWVASKATSDPDFDKLRSLTEDRVLVVVQGMRAKGKTSFTPDEMVQISEQAYKYVKDTTSQFRPPPTRINSPVGKSASSAMPAAPSGLPKNPSLFDVVKAAALNVSA